MDQLTNSNRKLVVYLDQNFLSEMAKQDDSSRPELVRIRELLQKGFQDEKLVVPRSHFHDVETSLAPLLKKEIVNMQGYVGQTQLRHREHIKLIQLAEALDHFLGEPREDISPRNVFSDDPNRRVQPFDIRVDMGMSRFEDQDERENLAGRMNEVRRVARERDAGFKEQLNAEIAMWGQVVSQYNAYQLRYRLEKAERTAEEFVQSKEFRNIPLINISSKMWAKLLTDYSARPIRRGDPTDIDLISSYLPYVDVLATDTFMANLVQQLGLADQYETSVFGASTREAVGFGELLNQKLAGMEPLHIPTAAIVVAPHESIKNVAFEFFKRLGLQASASERRGHWVEIIAFDDGRMPRYLHERVKVELPFYGFQEIEVQKVEPGAVLDALVSMAREKVRASRFVMIDKHRSLPDNFVETCVTYCQGGRGQILQYNIHSR